MRDVEFLRRSTDRTIKITLPGPFTMSRQAKNEFYDDEEELVMDFAATVNEEAHDLKRAGADVIQIDEPWIEAAPDVAARYAVPAIDRAFAGVPGTKALHMCFGYAQLVQDKSRGRYAFLEPLADSIVDQISIEAAQPRLDLGVLADLAGKTIILGVLDLSTSEVETADTVAARVRRAFDRLPPEQVVVAPDCGLKYLPRAAAEGKMRAMADAAAALRSELEG